MNCVEMAAVFLPSWQSKDFKSCRVITRRLRHHPPRARTEEAALSFLTLSRPPRPAPLFTPKRRKKKSEIHDHKQFTRIHKNTRKREKERRRWAFADSGLNQTILPWMIIRSIDWFEKGQKLDTLHAMSLVVATIYPVWMVADFHNIAYNNNST